VSLFLAALLVTAVLLIGVWAGICISENSELEDRELENLLFSLDFTESLDRETRRWG